MTSRILGQIQFTFSFLHAVLTVLSRSSSPGHLIVPVVSHLCLPHGCVGKGSHFSAVSGVTFPKYRLCMDQACMWSPLGAGNMYLRQPEVCAPSDHQGAMATILTAVFLCSSCKSL